jgi:hypothetical protein
MAHMPAYASRIDGPKCLDVVLPSFETAVVAFAQQDRPSENSVSERTPSWLRYSFRSRQEILTRRKRRSAGRFFGRLAIR